MTNLPEGYVSERIIVCGSRDWSDRARIADRLFDCPVTATIVHGAARGADRIAGQEAEKLGLLVEAHPYQTFISMPVVSAKRAPLVRNQHMAGLGAVLCIAFWDGRSRGTQHMVDMAESYDIPVEIIQPVAEEAGKQTDRGTASDAP